MNPFVKKEIAGLERSPAAAPAALNSLVALREETGQSMENAEKQLLSKVANADAEAFRILYKQYHHKVYFIAWKMLQSEPESEDAVQEIFAKIWVNRKKLTEIGFFNSWLNTVIRNHIYNCLRKKANEENVMHEMKARCSPQQEMAVDEAACHRELHTLVHRGMNSLPAQQKRVFHLSRIEGFKHGEIAEKLGISIETVKKHIMLSVGTIKHFLRERTK